MRKISLAFACTALLVSQATGVLAGPPKKPTKPAAKPGKEKVVTTKSGLKYIDLVVGKGASPKSGHEVTVHYVGTFMDGKEFDSDKGKGFPFAIGTGGVIPGWDEGVMTMKVGGKRKLIVPPSLAYGPGGYGPIPPNATLQFVVELVSVK